jgi:hypothetical protein
LGISLKSDWINIILEFHFGNFSEFCSTPFKPAACFQVLLDSPSIIFLYSCYEYLHLSNLVRFVQLLASLCS